MAKKKTETLDQFVGQVAEMLRDQSAYMSDKFGKVDERFDSMDRRFERIEDVLEKHTTILKRLDEERIFTLNYVRRLEHEIEKIKKHLAIA